MLSVLLSLTLLSSLTSMVTADVTSRIDMPAYTKTIIVPGEEWDSLWGPGPVEDSWKYDDLQSKSDADGFSRKKTFWYIYRNTGNLTYSDKTREPIYALGDEDILFDMTCYNAVSKNSQDGMIYYQKINLTSTPIISPDVTSDLATLKANAHFYCPKGECIHAECEGKTVPTWDETIYQ